MLSLFLALTMALSLVACSSDTPTPSGSTNTPGGNAEQSAATSNEVIELAWNVPDSDGHPWTESAKEIAEKIGERSNGSLKVTVYSNNQLGVSEALDMMSTGSLAMDLTGAGAFAGYYAPCEVFAMPYAFDDADQAYAYFESDYAKDIFNRIEEASGIMTISAWYFGDRNLTTNWNRNTAMLTRCLTWASASACGSSKGTGGSTMYCPSTAQVWRTRSL